MNDECEDVTQEQSTTKVENGFTVSENVVADDNNCSSKSVFVTENATSKALDSNSFSKKLAVINSTTKTSNNSSNARTNSASTYSVQPSSPSPSQSSQSDQENNVGIVNGPLPTKSTENTTKKVVIDDATTTTNAEASLIFVNQ